MNFDESEYNKLTDSEIQQIRSKIREVVNENPPTIGIVGVSGVGKSTTLNVLFRTNLPTSPTMACTKKFQTVDLSLTLNQGIAKGMTVALRVIDAPGLGEDVYRDKEYLRIYHNNLSYCDVVLWVLAARNRAIALDQQYLLKLKGHHGRIVFAINQVDLVDPVDWNTYANIPSENQEKNIAVICQDRECKIQSVFEGTVKMIPYSAKTGYNLEELFYFLIDAAPEERRWIFSSLKNFHYLDFVPAQIKELIRGKGGK